MASTLGRYFAKQLGKVLALAKEDKTLKTISMTVLLTKILNLLSEEKEVLAAMMGPVYEDGAVAGSSLALAALKSDVEARANEAVVRTLTNEITIINNYTYKLISAQVKESIAAGEAMTDLTKRIQSVYKFNKSRARTIARTESMKVMNRSTDVEYKDAGVERKQWVSSSGARESHADCSAQGAIPYDQPFQNGLRYPGDDGPASEIANCRCALSPVI